MIVPMAKAFAACRERDRDALLRRLRQLGVLHIVPAAPADVGLNGEERDERLRRVEASIRVLRSFEPRGARPEESAPDVVDEVLAIGQRAEHARTRLDALYREAEQLRLWGGAHVAQLRAIRDAGVDLRVLIAPDRALPYLRARFLQPLTSLSHHRALVAAIGLDPASISPRVEEVPPPTRDRDEVRAEAAEVERALEADRERLAELAWLGPELARERDRLEGEDRWQRVARSGLTDGSLFAVQGWLPAEGAGALTRELGSSSPAVAVRIADPQPEEQPPTLIRYHRWVRPVQSLFRMLGMVPGYREPDAGSIFMVALPVFAGIIIGDAGYGLLFVLASLLGRRALERAFDRDARLLLAAFGVAALVWGALTGVWFGVGTGPWAEAGGALGSVGRGLDSLRVIRGDDAATRMLLIKICFVIGCIHLVLAHLRRLLALFPDARSVAEAGWCIVLASMLGVIWMLFFGAGDAPAPKVVVGAGLVVGVVLVAGFGQPAGRLPRRLGVGLASSLLPFLGTFSDTLSYIRLMAVGLASYYLGSTFNLLGAGVATSTSWILGACVILAGHALNVGLILIAIFAHGVRLNVLEFSSNAGIHWTGYPYRPFSDRMVKERS